MERKTYYISLSHRTVLQDSKNASYEYEIVADEQQLSELMELFDEQQDADGAAFNRAITPALPYHDDEENDWNDDVLLRIYQKIYELGTPQTREGIESINALNIRGRNW